MLWAEGSKRVSARHSPDLNHLQTTEVVHWNIPVSDCWRTVQRWKEELTIWFPSKAIPGMKDHPGYWGDGVLSRTCCLISSSLSHKFGHQHHWHVIQLNPAWHKRPQLTAASCQAFRRRKCTLSRGNPVYQGHSLCAHGAKAKTKQSSHPRAPSAARACGDAPRSAGQPSGNWVL